MIYFVCEKGEDDYYVVISPHLSEKKARNRAVKTKDGIVLEVKNMELTSSGVMKWEGH